jgi:hypothetical protein
VRAEEQQRLRYRHFIESLIHFLPTFPTTLATPQSAAVIVVRAIALGRKNVIAHSFPANFSSNACHTSICCCNCWMRSLIHSLPTFPATLATLQSAAVIDGCDRYRMSSSVFQGFLS